MPENRLPYEFWCASIQTFVRHSKLLREMGDMTVRFIVLVLAAVLSLHSVRADELLPPLTEVAVTSTLDGESQPVLYWAPEVAATKPTVLFVFLHSWSSDHKQDNSKWQKQAVENGWIYLHPNFRGVNNSLKACGSRFARQDILDAIDFAQQKFNVDRTRVYLAGVSGGGHMSMLMAGHHPERFSAVSAWVGISELADWHAFHVKDGVPGKYAKMIQQSFGGVPGAGDAIDAEFRDRSPVYHLPRVGDLPVDIFAGVNDGHAGSVPVRHSIMGFNAIARAHQSALVSAAEMEQLWTQRKLSDPRPTDKEADAVLGRDIKLRRTSQSSRVTIFEGGHESIPEAAIEWLATKRRATP
jgi:poly(3-hydroxybutyrate) depolymerase